MDESFAVRAVIIAVGGLETGEATVGAEGFLMEPVAVSVELGFNKFIIPREMVFLGPVRMGVDEFVRFCPGFRFDLKTVDVGAVIGVTAESVGELMKNE